jgi:DHA2 family multidrug resistance protein
MAQAPAPLQGSALVLATLGLSVANFMEVLDITIANVSIPAISGDLGVSPNEGTWVITSYAVSNAIAVMAAGWLSDRFGAVRIFVAAVCAFTLFSLLCGLAPTFPALLTCRVAQGAVAGLMVPLSQALIVAIYPQEKRGLGMGIWAMTITVAPIIGPILGGWITDHYSWPWIFFLNVPVGIAAAALSWHVLAGHDAPGQRQPIDAVGMVLIIIWVGALQIFLDKGNELDWFGSPFIVALACIAGIGCVAFVLWELAHPHPIVDLRLFRRRNFSAATAALMIGFALFFAGSVILLPLWLQTQEGYTATWAGMAVAPAGLLAMVLSPLVGRSVSFVDARFLVSGAFLVFACVSFMRAGWTPGPAFSSVALPQLLQGIGSACFFSPLMSIALADLPPQSIPVGSGLVNFVRLIGTSFGASLVTTMWDHRQVAHRFDLVVHIAPGDPRLIDAQGLLSSLHVGDAQTQLAVVAREIERQAAIGGVVDIYWASGWGFLAIIALVWLCAKPRPTALHAG